MAKNTESYSDALVDTYRALRLLNAKQPVTSPVTPGAGVSKTTVHPSKRLRNWHRANRWDLNGKQSDSLRSYARNLASSDLSGNMTASAWLDRKGSK